MSCVSSCRAELIMGDNVSRVTWNICSLPTITLVARSLPLAGELRGLIAYVSDLSITTRQRRQSAAQSMLAGSGFPAAPEMGAGQVLVPSSNKIVPAPPHPGCITVRTCFFIPENKGDATTLRACCCLHIGNDLKCSREPGGRVPLLLPQEMFVSH